MKEFFNLFDLRLQPISSITNIAYPIAGYFWWTVDPLTSIALFCLGIGSFMYHSTPNRPFAKYRMWQSLDIMAIFFVFMALMGYYAHLAFDVAQQFIYFPVFLITALLSTRERQISSMTAIPIMMLIIMLLTCLSGNDFWYVLVFLIALAFNIPHVWISQEGTLHDVTHGIWHVLTSVAFYMMIP